MSLPRRRRKNYASPRYASEFNQDVAGILLIAIALFILVSNMSSSTGWVGLFLVKTFLRRLLGIGVYAVPMFIALYGTILLLRHEVKELAMRLSGLFFSFLSLLAFAQFYSANYFANEVQVFAGAGGVIGFYLRLILENTFGLIGSYIFLSTIALIAVIFVLNITVLQFFGFIFAGAYLMLKGMFSLLFIRRSPPLELDEAEEKPVKEAPKPLPKKVVAEAKTPLLVAPVIENIPKEIIEKIPPPPPPVKIFKAKEEKEDFSAALSGKQDGSYRLPPLELLSDAPDDEKDLEKNLMATTQTRKEMLEKVLRDFGIGATVVAIYQGPAITRYELQPEPGVKVSRIVSLSDDIALSLASGGIRIEAPIPGKAAVGIEVPNQHIVPVRLKSIVKTSEFQTKSSKLVVALGRDLSGAPVYTDLSALPHLLIAGTTGSGKSVCINSIIISLILRARPEEVRFLMIDPKMVELSGYDGIPHLLAPVVTKPLKAARTLRDWATKEMEFRYKLFHESGSKDIISYNKKMEKSAQLDRKIPRIVIIIDELADLMMAAAQDVETTICRLAQMARATGIHLVIATQRPSVDVITGLIKANIPSRIAFAVATQIDSRVILDMSGAEKLLGRGDMLYNPIGAMKPQRLQGSLVTEEETERVVDFIRKQGEPHYIDAIADVQEGDPRESGETTAVSFDRDELFIDAVKLVLNGGNASTSHLQRRFRIGYNRAARLMDEMEAAGIVSPMEGENKTRRIVATVDLLQALGIQQ